MCNAHRSHYSLSALILALAVAFIVRGQQEADLTFDASVKKPAYTTTHPKVLIDEAHFNFHTAGGRYKPFAELLTNDGYTVAPNKERFSAGSLDRFAVLVIANAAGGPAGGPDRSKPAFTNAECEAVR
jgi:hypothetical protein